VPVNVVDNCVCLYLNNNYNMEITITPIFNDAQQQIVDLILSIQQLEFNVPITLEDQPDLLDIESNYHMGGGGFWAAWAGEELIGTIAIIATGHRSCAVRKMFVKKDFRGKETGVAQQLLNTLIAYCRSQDIVHIYLGTVDLLKAAHRFYEKNGFERLAAEELPHFFPRMTADNVFYMLHLESDQ
jgi:GNAT superfamily N-acetyltransferase